MPSDMRPEWLADAPFIPSAKRVGGALAPNRYARVVKSLLFMRLVRVVSWADAANALRPVSTGSPLFHAWRDTGLFDATPTGLLL